MARRSFIRTGAIVGAALLLVLTGAFFLRWWNSFGGEARAGAPFAPARSEPPRGVDGHPVDGHPVATVTRSTVLRSAPGGRALARIDTRTRFGSSTVLAVRGRRPGWLRVIAPELGNGRTGWMRASDARVGGVPYSVVVDLSQRMLVVRREEEVVRRVRVAVGQPGVPTPTGQFAVTDSLHVGDPDSPYGCCALALSARQPSLPEGWPGGDRIAVHATRDPASIGQAASFGCLRAATADARWLIEKVSLGAPVKIQA